ncbi:K+ transport system, NAD-binding component [Acetivibrio thermocellus BC1]|nr:K+ transport system, NAD-binding component [Acetivibrio thermocellus BC1]
MFIVIAGGGKIGYYLVKTLLPYKHKIAIIESKENVCIKIANELHIPVINGDCTDLEILSEVELEKADVFIAVTGKDEDNLISCQLAKRNFGVKRTISRVNNPKNIEIFQKLGVDLAVSSTSIIAELIEQEVDYTGIKTLMKLRSGRLVLSEISITKNSPACNKCLKDIDIPKDCVLVSVIRGEEVIIPNGFTELKENDSIIAVSSKEDQDELKEYFVGKEKR